MEIQEGAEKPSESEDLHESPEKQAEIKEVTVVRRQMNEATDDPKAAEDHTVDIKTSEALEKASVDSVPLAQAAESIPADRSAEGTVPPSE